MSHNFFYPTERNQSKILLTSTTKERYSKFPRDIGRKEYKNAVFKIREINRFSCSFQREKRKILVEEKGVRSEIIDLYWLMRGVYLREGFSARTRERTRKNNVESPRHYELELRLAGYWWVGSE